MRTGVLGLRMAGHGFDSAGLSAAVAAEEHTGPTLSGRALSFREPPEAATYPTVSETTLFDTSWHPRSS